MADPNRPYASPFGMIQRGNALADRNYKGASSLPLSPLHRLSVASYSLSSLPLALLRAAIRLTPQERWSRSLPRLPPRRF